MYSHNLLEPHYSFAPYNLEDLIGEEQYEEPRYKEITKGPSLAELRKEPHWSFSSINGLLNICPMQWAFRKVYDIRPEHTDVALVFGGAFHMAAERFVLSVIEDEVYDINDAMDDFTYFFNMKIGRTINLKVPEKKTIEGLNEQGRGMIKCLVENWDDKMEVVGVSIPFCVPLIDVNGKETKRPLIGEFDLVLRDPKTNKIIIVDWKTSAARWAVDKAHTDLQATAYIYAYEQAYGKKASFRYDVVTKTKTPSYAQHPTERERFDGLNFVEMAKIAERIVEEELFYPSISWACSNCSFKKKCQNGEIQNDLLVHQAAVTVA